MQQVNHVVDKATLIRKVWGAEVADYSHDLVAVAIHRLRQAIEANPAHPQYIHTVPTHGYVFRDAAA